jgi:hypothetical protein
LLDDAEFEAARKKALQEVNATTSSRGQSERANPSR